MTAFRFPFWHVLLIAIYFTVFAFVVLYLWSLLYLGKPTGYVPMCLVFMVGILAMGARDLDHWCYQRDKLLANAETNRACLAIQAFMLINGDRFYAGELPRLRGGSETYSAIQSRFVTAYSRLTKLTA